MISKNEQEMLRAIAEIAPLNQEAKAKASERLDQLAKPPGSLGGLEEIVLTLAGITGKPCSDIDKRCVLVFASDNGVVEEGVASAPQGVTAAQTINILKGVTGVAVLAQQYNTDVIVADMGVNADISHPELVCHKIAYGTKNIANGPAMTREQAIDAITFGFELAKGKVKEGYKAIGIGEMGIGNTTTSSAVIAALLKLSKDEIAGVVGKGAGLTDGGYQKKVEVITGALSINNPSSEDAIDTLCKVGGFDLAAMAGAFLGSAYAGIPVVIDGFISVAAALCAARMSSNAREYMLASHRSYERGYKLAASELKIIPYLELGMRLGEGSGCPLLFSIMDGACAVMKKMATFAQASINDDYLDEIKKGNAF